MADDDSSDQDDTRKKVFTAVASSLRKASKDSSDRTAAIASNIRPVAYRRGGKVRKAKGRRKSRGRAKAR